MYNMDGVSKVDNIESKIIYNDPGYFLFDISIVRKLYKLNSKL